MGLMSFKEGAIVDYVPAFGGNRLDKNPTIIGIKPLNNDGSIDFMSALQKQLADCEDLKEKEIVSKEVAKQTFIDHIAYVKVYTVVDKKGKLTEITTGEQLYINGSKQLVDEVTLAAENSSRLSAGQAKNFLGASAGSEK
ncbi:hypothetical protein KAR91_77590 [Candidatus Pacearchaeota archaeon]|nr:hypothetical protein [Candidatus Pacearchaeota archaeon]